MNGLGWRLTRMQGWISHTERPVSRCNDRQIRWDFSQAKSKHWFDEIRMGCNSWFHIITVYVSYTIILGLVSILCDEDRASQTVREQAKAVSASTAESHTWFLLSVMFVSFSQPWCLLDLWKGQFWREQMSCERPLCGTWGLVDSKARSWLLTVFQNHWSRGPRPLTSTHMRTSPFWLMHIVLSEPRFVANSMLLLSFPPLQVKKKHVKCSTYRSILKMLAISSGRCSEKDAWQQWWDKAAFGITPSRPGSIQNCRSSYQPFSEAVRCSCNIS